MTNKQKTSPRFLNGIQANIIYWQQKTSNLANANNELFRVEFANLIQAVRFGIVHPTTRLETAHLMCQAFLMVEQSGQWDSWLPLLNRLLENIDDKPLRCQLYKQQGQLYRSKRQLNAAIEALLMSAQDAEKIQDRLALAEAHLHLGSIYLHKRDTLTAEKYAKQALQTLALLENVDRQLSAVLFTLGRIDHMKGNYSQSEARLTKAIQIGRISQPHTQLARMLNALANTLHLQGNFEASERAYLEALQLLNSTISWLDTVRLQLSLGSLYVDMNLHSRAEELFIRTQKILEEKPGQYYWVAMTANNLGNVLLEMKKPMEAEIQLRRSVKLRRNLSISLPLANSCKSWGKALYQLNCYQEAKAAVDEALSILAGFENDVWANQLLEECLALQQTIESAEQL